MKKILILLVFLGMAASLFSIDLKKGDWYFKYKIILNTGKEGVLFLTLGSKKFESQYLDIVKQDEIPFYSQEKAGEYIDGIKATMLNFKGKILNIYYDNSSIPEEILKQRKWLNEGKKAVVIEDKLAGFFVFEPMPLVTLENILIGFALDKIEEKKEMFLYEEEYGTKFLIRFIKKGNNEEINKNCKVTRYICERIDKQKGGTSPLFDILVSCNENIPIRVEAGSRRWQFVLVESGYSEEKTYDISQGLIEQAKEKILAEYGRSWDIQIKNGVFNNGNYTFNYSASKELTSYSPMDLVYQYFIDAFCKEKSLKDKAKAMKGIKKLSENKWGIEINKAEVCTSLKGTYNKGKCYVYQSGNEEVCIKALLDVLKPNYPGQVLEFHKDKHVITEKDNSKTLIDVNMAAKAYLDNILDKQKFKGWQLTNVLIENMDVNNIEKSKLIVEFKYPKNIDEKVYRETAAQLLKSSFYTDGDTAPKSLVDEIVPGKDSFLLIVDKNKLDNTQKKMQEIEALKFKECIKNANVNIAGNTCTIEGKSEIVESSFIEGLKNKIFKLSGYPDKSYFFKNRMKKNGNTWNYSKITDVSNPCL